MITVSDNIKNMINAPARTIKARVELYEGSTLNLDSYNKVLLEVFRSSDAVKEITVERVADDGRFFGFGVCQKLIVKLIDKDRLYNVEKGQFLEISFGVDGDYTYPCPLFRIEEVSRDESNNDLTLTAYDFIYKANEHRVSELVIADGYTINTFAAACANVLNLPIKFPEGIEEFDRFYTNGANFEGSETLREALDAVADATQTIYYVDWDWRLTFKRLDQDADAAVHIDKSKYFSLTNKTDRKLTSICSVTELEDNLTATTGEEGVTQYVRNNEFWDLCDNRAVLIQNAINAIGGITSSQFNVEWRGDFTLEIGDKITIATKDGGELVGYILNDDFTYNGGFKEKTHWTFTEHNAETASNPITLAEVVQQTFAKVDKANKTITLMASETDKKIQEAADGAKQYTDTKMGEIKVTTDAITQTVSQTQESIDSTNQKVSELEVRADGVDTTVSNFQTTMGSELDTTNSTIEDLKNSLNQNVEDINNSLVTLSTQVSTQISDEDIQFKIETALSDGVTSVSTTTGYTFDNEGLTIAKSGSEMRTQVTEDGMTVYKGSEAVLVANNEGVHAEDLVATTYLDIGGRSRFENFERSGSYRTGCFWIG